jgi:thiol-disulfide isomerase/thioredoxin
MLKLQQYTTPTCAVCRQHKPMLADLAKEYDGELQIEYVNVLELPTEQSQEIHAVPFYKLLAENGTIIELWTGTKSKAEITNILELALFEYE